jgi:HPt (histidine-containing phosphotransfer) domain-containing protein
LPRHERDRLLRRIEELQQTLRKTRSDDVRVALEQALDDCREHLCEVEELLGERDREVAGGH